MLYYYRRDPYHVLECIRKTHPNATMDIYRSDIPPGTLALASVQVHNGDQPLYIVEPIKEEARA